MKKTHTCVKPLFVAYFSLFIYNAQKNVREEHKPNKIQTNEQRDGHNPKHQEKQKKKEKYKTLWPAMNTTTIGYGPLDKLNVGYYIYFVLY